MSDKGTIQAISGAPPSQSENEAWREPLEQLESNCVVGRASIYKKPR